MSAIRQLRLEHGWSQPRLAREAGVSNQTVIRAEADKPLSELTVYRLALALGVDADSLSGLALTK